MTKLSQAIATLPDIKTRADAALTSAYHTLGKESSISGIQRTYQPLEDGGETLPAESTLVQVNTEKVLQTVAQQMADLFNAVGVVESTNSFAYADIIVDGKVLVPQVTVPYLLFLTKKLTDVRTFVNKLPVLDPSSKWTFDKEIEAYRADVVGTSRTRKLPTVISKAKATEHHPEQTEIIYVDEIVGTWSSVKLSGAIENSRKRQLIQRIDTLLGAVKYAKEEANSATAVPFTAGPLLADYLFS